MRKEMCLINKVTKYRIELEGRGRRGIIRGEELQGRKEEKEEKEEENYNRYVWMEGESKRKREK